MRMQPNSVCSPMIAKKNKDTYVKIEDNWIDCEFEHDGWLKIRK